jgi:hypothetical protein
MAESRPLQPSTEYDPYNTIQLPDPQHLSNGYDNPTNEKKSFQVMNGEGSSGKDSRNIFDLETPPSQEAVPSKARSSRWHHVTRALRYGFTVVLVGAALAIPIIIFHNDKDLDGESPETQAERKYRNLLYYIFAWLLCSWLGACAADMLWLAFPYVFRLVAG